MRVLGGMRYMDEFSSFQLLKRIRSLVFEVQFPVAWRYNAETAVVLLIAPSSDNNIFRDMILFLYYRASHCHDDKFSIGVHVYIHLDSTHLDGPMKKIFIFTG